jgi:YHS domain-containing protein
MILELVAGLALSHGAIPAGELSCPIMGSPAKTSGAAVDYAGVRYRFCCGGCDATFQGNPSKALKADGVKGKTLGVSLYDPVAAKRVTSTSGKGGTSDFGGVRYYFLSAANKSAFDADPKKYGTIPDKEAMFCPVMKVELKNYYGTGGYVDSGGVRYYVCCEGCLGALKANPSGFVANASAHVKAPKSFSVSSELAKASGF